MWADLQKVEHKIEALYLALANRVPGIVDWIDQAAGEVLAQAEQPQQEAAQPAPPEEVTAAGEPKSWGEAPPAPQPDQPPPAGAGAVTLSAEDAAAFEQFKAEQQAKKQAPAQAKDPGPLPF